MRNAPTRDLDAILGKLASIGGMIAHGTPNQQKEALAAMFERIEVDHRGEITRLAPREWTKTLFDYLPNKSPAEMAGPDSSWVHPVPPRGFEPLHQA